MSELVRYAKIIDGAIAGFHECPPLSADQIKHVPTKDGSKRLPMMRPLVVEKPDFDPATQVREPPAHVIEDGRVIERHLVRPKNAAEIESMRAARISEIKHAARGRIAEIVSGSAEDDPYDVAVKQISILSRLVEYLIREREPGVKLSAEAEADLAASLALFEKIGTERAASDKAETRIAQAVTPQAIIADPGLGKDR